MDPDVPSLEVQGQVGRNLEKPVLVEGAQGRGGNKIIFKVPSNQNHTVILWSSTNGVRNSGWHDWEDLLCFFLEPWKLEGFPEGWKKCNGTPIYKVSKKNPVNFKPISLSSVPGMNPPEGYQKSEETHDWEKPAWIHQEQILLDKSDLPLCQNPLLGWCELWPLFCCLRFFAFCIFHITVAL